MSFIFILYGQMSAGSIMLHGYKDLEKHEHIAFSNKILYSSRFCSTRNTRMCPYDMYEVRLTLLQYLFLHLLHRNSSGGSLRCEMGRRKSNLIHHSFLTYMQAKLSKFCKFGSIDRKLLECNLKFNFSLCYINKPKQNVHAIYVKLSRISQELFQTFVFKYFWTGKR